MAVFRVEKSRDFTVMSNFHLKDKSLTLKAKGLLSMILSLPEEWNYTTRGLATICKEGVDSISATLRELESAGYILRRRMRDAKGKITDTEYTIYERPHEPFYFFKYPSINRHRWRNNEFSPEQQAGLDGYD